MTYYRVVSIRTMYGMLMIHEALIIWHISLQIMCIAQALFTYTTQHIINNPSRVREENYKQWHSSDAMADAVTCFGTFSRLNTTNSFEVREKHHIRQTN